MTVPLCAPRCATQARAYCYANGILRPTRHDADPFLGWLNHKRSLTSVLQTTSGSHTVNEQNFPPDYARSVCYLFAWFGASSTSLLFSSGDSDVGGADSESKKTAALALSNYNPPRENGRDLTHSVSWPAATRRRAQRPLSTARTSIARRHKRTNIHDRVEPWQRRCIGAKNWHSSGYYGGYFRPAGHYPQGKHCSVIIPNQGVPRLARRVIYSLQVGCRDLASGT